MRTSSVQIQLKNGFLLISFFRVFPDDVANVVHVAMMVVVYVFSYVLIL